MRISQARRSSRRAPPATGKSGPGRPSRSAGRRRPAHRRSSPVGEGCWQASRSSSQSPAAAATTAPPPRRRPTARHAQLPDSAPPVAGAGGGQEVVAEALHEGEHLVLVPGARVRVDGQAGDLGAEALGARGRGLGAGRLLPVAVVVAADLAHRPQQGQGQLGRLGDQLVLGHLVQQHRDPAGVDEPAGRKVGSGTSPCPPSAEVPCPPPRTGPRRRTAPPGRPGARATGPGGRGTGCRPRPAAAGTAPRPAARHAGRWWRRPARRSGRSRRVEADRPPVGPAHGRSPPDRPAGDQRHLDPLGLGDHQVALGRRSCTGRRRRRRRPAAPPRPARPPRPAPAGSRPG